jgi:putative spermidine/putrescine transport system ATP-binding protein
MNKGRIEQVGTPSQIYNHPQTAFVASFVGTVNLLHATVQDPVDGIVLVHGQPLTGVGAVRDKRPGDSVTLALRPEVIALAGAGGVGDGLRGTVEDVTFLGTLVRVLARVGPDTLTFDLLNHPDLVVPERGQPVVLTVAGRSCLLLEDAAALPEAAVAAG